MPKPTNRRKFLKEIGAGSVAAGILPVRFFGDAPGEESDMLKNGYASRVETRRAFNAPYTGEFLNRVAFPVGGIGSGMFCLEGTGAISHMSVRHKPEIFNEPGLFAAVSVKGKKNGAKILEGPVPDWKKFGQRGAGNGQSGATTGLPRFHKAQFTTQFPFGVIDLEDADIPLKIQLTGWSPFIPGDENNSSMPVGAIEYKFGNPGAAGLELVFSFNARNFLKLPKGTNLISPTNNGFVLSEKGNEEQPYAAADFAIFTDEPTTRVDHCWFRGGWWDPLTMAWNAIRDGEMNVVAPVEKDAPGASLYVPLSLKPGEEKTIRVMFAWWVPESNEQIGKMGERESACNYENGCCQSPDEQKLDKYDGNFDGKTYKPWYSSQFRNIAEVVSFWRSNYHELRRKSDLFREAFYNSSLPPEVTEAIAANLSILKSPTVQRQFDGRLWNFEGSGDEFGCCHGSCTHVWNYAQAIAHLFPALERSLRATEFCESQNAEGHQNFRSNIPISTATHDFHAAADGQLGGIMKVHREWRTSGDGEWMKRMYPLVKSSMDYCIRTWDPGNKGIIEEPHHNTYDIEFWGPDGMHGSFYLGALAAIIAMGRFLKKDKDVKRYSDLLAKGKAFMEKELYDGEYFIQKIQYSGLRAANPVEESGKSYGGTYSDEARKLLEKEGPKYQYGAGCLSDGVLGAWIGRMCGLPDTLDPAMLRSHLLAIHKYNLKDNLSEHANPQRPSFALGDEGGLLLCSWPKGGKLSLPFVYSDEVWTGIEHQVAAHLMLMGRVKEGLDILQTCRLRYDGRTRNPFNEYECGSWYARALSSYGYIQCLTGMRFDAVDHTLYVDSQVGDFTAFLSTENGFGNVTLKGNDVSVRVLHGSIPIESVMVAGKKTTFKKS